MGRKHICQMPWMVAVVVSPPCWTSTLWLRDFPGGPVIKTMRFQCRGHRFASWSGN